MIPNEVLAQLQDIDTPPVAGPWPPAPGWWLLAALIIGLLVLGGIWLWRWHRRTAPRRDALARLDRLGIAPEQAGTEWYAALNRLLKQAAIHLYPEQNPEALSGRGWQDFLARTSDMPPEQWQPLVEACYRPNVGITPPQAQELASRWIRRQRW